MLRIILWQIIINKTKVSDSIIQFSLITIRSVVVQRVANY